MISACFCDFEMNHYVAMCSINEFLMTVVVLCFFMCLILFLAAIIIHIFENVCFSEIYFMILYLCFNDFSMILEQVAYGFMISYVKQNQKEKNIAKQICTKDGYTII